MLECGKRDDSAVIACRIFEQYTLSLKRRKRKEFKPVSHSLTNRLISCFKELQRRIRAKQMRRYSKIQRIPYKDHVTNEDVSAKIQQAIGPHKDLLTILKRRKPKWYEHVSRSSGLAITILQGTVKVGKKTWQAVKEVGRQHQEEWTGREFAKSHGAVENRGEWR